MTFIAIKVIISKVHTPEINNIEHVKFDRYSAAIKNFCSFALLQLKFDYFVRKKKISQFRCIQERRLKF